MKKKIVAIVATLTVLLMPVTVNADTGISYLEKTYDVSKVVTTEKTASATSVTAMDTEWNSGWYVLDSDVKLTNRLTVNGTVNLILMNGKTLTAPLGITLKSGNTLNVFAQSDDKDQMGTIDASAKNGHAAIGGCYGGNGGANDDGGPGQSCGTFNWHGGKLILTNQEGACIGGGDGGGGGFADFLDSRPGAGGAGGNGGIVSFYGGTAVLCGQSGIGGGTAGNAGDSYIAPAVQYHRGGSGGSLTIYDGEIDINAYDGVCFGGGSGGIGSNREEGVFGGEGSDGGSGGTFILKGGKIRFMSDSYSCIGGGAGGRGGFLSSENRYGASGRTGAPTTITIDGNPIMTAGNSENDSKSVNAYNNEQYFAADYFLNVGSIISTGNCWITCIGLIIIVATVLTLVVFKKKKR